MKQHVRIVMLGLALAMVAPAHVRAAPEWLELDDVYLTENGEILAGVIVELETHADKPYLAVFRDLNTGRDVRTWHEVSIRHARERLESEVESNWTKVSEQQPDAGASAALKDYSLGGKDSLTLREGAVLGCEGRDPLKRRYELQVGDAPPRKFVVLSRSNPGVLTRFHATCRGFGNGETFKLHFRDPVPQVYRLPDGTLLLATVRRAVRIDASKPVTHIGTVCSDLFVLNASEFEKQLEQATALASKSGADNMVLSRDAYLQQLICRH
jgi:hypothetical protein